MNVGTYIYVKAPQRQKGMVRNTKQSNSTLILDNDLSHSHITVNPPLSSKALWGFVISHCFLFELDLKLNNNSVFERKNVQDLN